MALEPPPIIAIADGLLWQARAHRAPFAFAVGKLAAACRDHPWRAGLLLRQHRLSVDDWLVALEELQWLHDLGLVVGITAPAGTSRVSPLPQLTKLGVAWLQIPEQQGESWLADPEGVDQPGLRFAWARSCHELGGVQAALAGGASWAMLSPVLATPSKPDVRPLGWAALAEASARYPHQIVALGGMDARAVGQALRAGAAGIAVVRAWQDQPLELAAAVTAALQHPL